MRISPQSAVFINISDEERKVLLHIDLFPKSTAEIVRGTEMPRTTVLRILQKFHERGFVRKHRITRRRSGWQIISIKDIELSMETLLSDFGIGQNEKKPTRIMKDEHEVVVYRGKKEMMELAKMADTFFSGERILWLRSSKLWSEWVKHGFKNRITEVIKLFREKGVITEFILDENFIQSDFAYGGKKFIKEYYRYPAIVHTIPDKYLNFFSDIMVFRDAVSIMNWKDEMAVLIRNRDLVSFFKSIFEYVEDNSKRVNISELAEKYLEE
jgi:hypothetical protein